MPSNKLEWNSCFIKTPKKISIYYDTRVSHVTLCFQVIISSIWIFSVIFYLPLFLVAKFDKEKGFCTWKWPEKWIRKAYSVVWFAFVVLPLLLMVTLYSRVVYTLWFKHCNEDRRTFQQRVSGHEEVYYLP